MGDNGNGNLASEPQQNGGHAPPIVVPSHGTTRYLRSVVEVSDGTVRWTAPRALLGILPIGDHIIEVPIGDVDSIRTIGFGRAPHWLNLAFGIALALGPTLFLPWWLAAPIAILGTWIVLIAIGPKLEIVTTTGRRQRIGVCFRHQFDADIYVEVVTDLAERARIGS